MTGKLLLIKNLDSRLRGNDSGWVMCDNFFYLD